MTDQTVGPNVDQVGASVWTKYGADTSRASVECKDLGARDRGGRREPFELTAIRVDPALAQDDLPRCLPIPAAP
jgi:hypothetical protein